MEVRNAVVLVTGASSGIGRAAALALGRAGACVAVAARRRQRLEELAAHLERVLVVPTDLADEAAAAAMIDDTVARFGRIDVLVNNAGAGVVARGDAIDPVALRRGLEANFVGHVVATRRAVSHMRRAGRGHVINVGSPAALMGSPCMGIYAASKGAMSAWTRTLQTEWAGTPIAVSEYLPGLVASDFGASAGAAAGVDVLESPTRSRLWRPLAVAQAPEGAAARLVELIRRPRLMAYSSATTRLLCWLAHVPRVRRRMGVEMARSVRGKLGLPVFGEP